MKRSDALPSGADFDVLIVGAGPVGLTTANILGGNGISTLVVESRDTLIDYPRGIGLDDESFRVFQSIGLSEAIIPHTVADQIMRFVDGKGRLLAEMAPSSREFGWPKRNGFVQPLVDVELLAGLDRYPSVEVRWSHTLEGLEQGDTGVTASIRKSDGELITVTARYLVGADGGRSSVRKLSGIGFQGTTSHTRWIVVDIENDPLGYPNVYVGADPKRPYVSVSVAHGIRRFEFMIMDGETEEEVATPAFVNSLLARFIDDPESLSIIRSRVYTHSSRIADSFRSGRVLVAGDAAHLMPVWQGQGYNSGIRDAANLGWKLAAVVQDYAGDALLDSYDMERREHARSMIELSTTVGKFISPTSHILASVRDVVVRGMALIPSLKRYLVEMRFKPMPRYRKGAVVHASHTTGKGDHSPVGRMFIQPRVATRSAGDVMLDDAIGPWFAVVSWNNDPTAVLDVEALAFWRSFGARFVTIRPIGALGWGITDEESEVLIVGDYGALKKWFDAHEESVLFLRPDRYVAAACTAQSASGVTRQLAQAMSADMGDKVSIAHRSANTVTPKGQA